MRNLNRLWCIKLLHYCIPLYHAADAFLTYLCCFGQLCVVKRRTKDQEPTCTERRQLSIGEHILIHR